MVVDVVVDDVFVDVVVTDLWRRLFSWHVFSVKLSETLYLKTRGWGT